MLYSVELRLPAKPRLYGIPSYVTAASGRSPRFAFWRIDSGVDAGLFTLRKGGVPGSPTAATGGAVARGCAVKVLYVLHSLERSGAEVMLVQAAPLLCEDGLELHALATGESVGLYAEQMAAARFTVHHLPLGSRVTHLARFYGLLRRNGSTWCMSTPRGPSSGTAAGASGGCPTHRPHGARCVRLPRSFVGRAMATAPRRVPTASGARGRAEPSVQQAEKRIYGIPTTLIPNWTDPRRSVQRPMMGGAPRLGFSSAFSRRRSSSSQWVHVNRQEPRRGHQGARGHHRQLSRRVLLARRQRRPGGG